VNRAVTIQSSALYVGDDGRIEHVGPVGTVYVNGVINGLRISGTPDGLDALVAALSSHADRLRAAALTEAAGGAS
jgi:hypothetical protein